MRKFKILILGTVVCALLSGCVKLWENEWQESIPLPETEIPVAPDPWEPTDTYEVPVGE